MPHGFVLSASTTLGISFEEVLFDVSATLAYAIPDSCHRDLEETQEEGHFS